MLGFRRFQTGLKSINIFNLGFDIVHCYCNTKKNIVKTVALNMYFMYFVCANDYITSKKIFKTLEESRSRLKDSNLPLKSAMSYKSSQ